MYGGRRRVEEGKNWLGCKVEEDRRTGNRRGKERLNRLILLLLFLHHSQQLGVGDCDALELPVLAYCERKKKH